MASLYELTADILKLNELLTLGELDRETLEDAILNTKEDIAIKAENYCKWFADVESDMEGLKKEIDRLTARYKVCESAIKNGKDLLKQAMALSGQPKIKGQLFSLSICKTAPSVEMDEAYIENIPEKYLIPQEPKIDRKAILADLKSNDAEVLKSLEGVAHLKTSDYLRIS